MVEQQAVSLEHTDLTLRASRVKFLYILSIFFLISFVYNILQPLKKTIIMNVGAGAEIMPYLKPFAVVPSSILVTWYFLYLTHKFDRNKVFRLIILTFLGYFSLYTFVLAPYREFLAAHTVANFLEYALPASFHAGPAVLRYWMDSLFYVSAELWGSAVLSTLLWGTVHEISSYEEAQQYYPFYTVAANSSGILSGHILSSTMCLGYNENFRYGHCAWDQCFLWVMLTVLFSSALSLVLFRQFVQSGYSQTAKNRESLCEKAQRKANKPRLSLRNIATSLAQSRNLFYIAIIVVVYNLVYNLSDVVVNKQIHLAYPDDPKALSAFLGDIDKYKSILATFLSVFVSSYSLKRFGWTVTALVTPLAYILTGTLFYCCFILNSHGWLAYSTFMALDPTTIVLYLGGLHFCATKGAKYSLFDATKEMAYHSLNTEERTSGKAVVDGIVSRFGKSGGSFIMFVLFAFVGNDITLTTPYIFTIVTFITLFWFYAVINLGQRFRKKYPEPTRKETLSESVPPAISPAYSSI